MESSTKMSGVATPTVKSRVSSKSIRSEKMKIKIQRAASQSDRKYEEEEELLELDIRRRKRELMKRKEEARLKAQEHIIEEFESECSSENPGLDIDEETKEEGLNRFFQSQGAEEAPPTLRPDEPPVMINSCPPDASNNWNKISASLETCMAQLTKVNMQQILSAQLQSAALNQLPKVEVPILLR